MYGNYAFLGITWILHVLFCLAFMFAVASAVIWMVRFASKAELKKIFWTCLVVGGIGMLITGVLAGGTMMRGWDHDYDDQDRGDMRDAMEDMMDWDEEDEGTEESAPEAENAETTESTETVAQ